jgi:hypothetical protein
MIGKAVIVGLALAAVGTAARADGNSGAADLELEFGAIRTFTSEGAAKAHCGKDTVVWADRYAGYYFFAREDQYGRTKDGAYACWHEARRANYWSSSPMGSIGEGHGPGRIFPDRFPDPTS